MFKFFNILFALSVSVIENVDCIPKPNVHEPPNNPMPQWNLPGNLPPIGPIEESQIGFWYENSKTILERQLMLYLNTNKAKNVILFIGDGMSISTITATRMYMGGEEKQLSFEKFPFSGLSKTYCVNHQVGDSACTANAMYSGVKNNYGTLGVTSSVQYGNCTAQQIQEYHLENIFKWAQDAGKSTGIVTNTRLTHATPAAAYAKSAHRDWENDSITPNGCVDIAQQLVHGEIGKKMKVYLGGGRRELVPTSTLDSLGNAGLRTDDRNLIEEWLSEKLNEGKEAVYVDNRENLLNINSSEVECLLGVFNHSHMDYFLEADHENEPTLSEMSLAAIEILSRNENGYLLLVEGGKIDIAHHESLARLAIDETKQLHVAVDDVIKISNVTDTLIIVTSDHSHTMTIGGYSRRGNNIFGQGDTSTEDHMPFFTLTYANGLGYFKHRHANGSRINPSEIDFTKLDLQYPAAVPLDMESHGGDDVAVYAIGPWSHLFSGTYEQNFIAEGIKYAACIGSGPHAHFCSNGRTSSYSRLLFGVAVLMSTAWSINL